MKRATVAAPVATPAPAPARVTVSGKGRPRALPAAVVGTCGLTALPGRYDGRAARETAAVRAAGPVVHDVPAAVPGEALRHVLYVAQATRQRSQALRILNHSESHFALGYERECPGALIGYLQSSLTHLGFFDDSTLLRVSTAITEAVCA